MNKIATLKHIHLKLLAWREELTTKVVRITWLKVLSAKKRTKTPPTSCHGGDYIC
jgi:hypothetical protein